MLVYPLHSYISVYMHLVTFVSANIVHDLVSALLIYVCRTWARYRGLGIGVYEYGMKQNVNTDTDESLRKNSHRCESGIHVYKSVRLGIGKVYRLISPHIASIVALPI